MRSKSLARPGWTGQIERTGLVRAGRNRLGTSRFSKLVTSTNAFSTTASSASLVSFLTTHPSISHLTLHSHGLALRLPANALPRLTHLACAAPALSSLPVRKLKHVILTDAPFIPLLGDKVLSALGGDQSHREFGRGWRDASPAPDHIESLRSVTLRLGHVIISPIQAPLILEPFARHVPALKKLGIVAGPSFFTTAVLESLTPVLEGFTELKTIRMECNAEARGPLLGGSPIGECASLGGALSMEPVLLLKERSL
ncbi:hypothetical protein RHS01_08071 [Rhizoctonia solani]|uniref:Uncharacterized protein n=1 Tax=Rhizoctonia solani TaxID=456999 RepID=A0A8H7I9I7_9AGAM|nr:hypothetical protein RHS01_08071 [Rhizoctonia solani]